MCASGSYWCATSLTFPWVGRPDPRSRNWVTPASTTRYCITRRRNCRLAIAASGALGANRNTAATNSRSAVKLSLPPSMQSYTRATLGLLMSMFAYLLSRSGSPAAIEGSIPPKEAAGCEHSRWSARDLRFRHCVPPQKMFRTRRVSVPHGNLNSGTSIPADGRLGPPGLALTAVTGGKGAGGGGARIECGRLAAARLAAPRRAHRDGDRRAVLGRLGLRLRPGLAERCPCLVGAPAWDQQGRDDHRHDGAARDRAGRLLVAAPGRSAARRHRADHRRSAGRGRRGTWHRVVPPLPWPREHCRHHVLDTPAVRGAAAQHLPERGTASRLRGAATARAAARADRRARRDADRGSRRGIRAVAQAA